MQVNIIVATQILEEGLDVQSCNLVVRFDPSPTVCSFIQSRGRARMKGSDYLLLIKRRPPAQTDIGRLELADGALSAGRSSTMTCDGEKAQQVRESRKRVRG
ncbi:hypothetical protein Taro_024008 [Colocasia esculenta]|uniref:Helicase C-terminal domain-containing protein n=1 Tax=Colocasia esculenta TaxID=4460 RepID=A0A843UZ42_COLES|nr:hypothetical protein [Colocasia esculenta]